MKYLLDTNICIYIIKQKPLQVVQKLKSIDLGFVAISSITWSELIYGVEKSAQKDKNLKALLDFITPFDILPWGQNEAQCTGEIRANLSKQGQVIGPFDLQIAGHAKSLNLILVTNNEKEFSRVDGLKLENWV